MLYIYIWNNTKIKSWSYLLSTYYDGLFLDITFEICDKEWNILPLCR
jgi:hypothetical protein